MHFSAGIVIALTLCSLIPNGAFGYARRLGMKEALLSELAGQRNDEALTRHKRSSEGHWHYGGFGGGGGGGGGGFGVGGGMRGLFWGLALANLLTPATTAATTTAKP
ncbi:hypothetical protein BV898_09129 [Hypsibius exemplaris]|uniref:Uncharacterized protein n=1 Tax=Hypsibius exemplaris TaxID=2072580 RepID=A0A1W0WNS7_HYPEX|nr:hypothetical protein BV898_09129 [Hypsibius exemplaris]